MPFPLGSAPNSSCCIQHVCFLLLAGKIALAPMLNVPATPSWHCPLLTVVRILSLLQTGQPSLCTKPPVLPVGLCGRLPVFTSPPPPHDDMASGWGSMHLLLTSTVMALHPMAKDALDQLADPTRKSSRTWSIMLQLLLSRSS